MYFLACTKNKYENTKKNLNFSFLYNLRFPLPLTYLRKLLFAFLYHLFLRQIYHPFKQYRKINSWFLNHLNSLNKKKRCQCFQKACGFYIKTKRLPVSPLNIPQESQLSKSRIFSLHFCLGANYSANKEWLTFLGRIPLSEENILFVHFQFFKHSK